MESEVRNRKVKTTNKISKSSNDGRQERNGTSQSKKAALDADDRPPPCAEECADDVQRRCQNERVQRVRDEPHVDDRGRRDESRVQCENICESNANGTNDASFSVQLHLDPMTVALFVVAFWTRIYRLSEPNNIVFDELHYGKYVSLYMRRTFFFDQHPPLGKQLIAGVAYLAGYSGNYTFSRIGSEYSTEVPIFWLRLLPAIFGSLLAPCVYKLLLQVRLNRWTSALGGILIILDNALLSQSRFVLMESMLLTFSLLGLLFLLKSHDIKTIGPAWLLYALTSAICLTCAVSVKFAGIYTVALAALTALRHLWLQLPDRTISNLKFAVHILVRSVIFVALPIAIYIGLFYVHLGILNKAGPHDSIMTSAFQASLEGGLASITKGQPLNVVHGSQITLRHTLGRTCWMHSHTHVYPVRYADGRGSSHQQQVTCYSFKDVNNWWIVKRPELADLVVGDSPDPVQHGDEIQLVHGITSRALNTHDVAAAMTPQCQEVSCYIDYNVSMSAQITWRVDIINRDTEGPIWHAIRSEIRLIHVGTGLALRFSGRQLPEWGFNQHEIVADRVVEQQDTIWNVEEHRYTKTQDQKERERQLLTAEMIPTAPTVLSFWQKFQELQNKMMWHSDPIQSHMYGSEPLEWPLMSKGIAYWVDKTSNAQIHLIGNILIWYSGTAAIFIYAALFVVYLLRRRRLCFDLPPLEWRRFQLAGELFFGGYLLHFVPYLFVERTMFLHNYLPAFVFKVMLLCFVVEHVGLMVMRWKIRRSWSKMVGWLYAGIVVGWVVAVAWVWRRFLVLSYGTTRLTADDVVALRWKDTWDFILHKDLP